MNRQIIYDEKYVNRKPNGYYRTQLSTSVKPDTYSNVYDTHRETWVPYRGIAWLCVIAAVLYLALFYGWLDWLPEVFK